MSKPSKPESKAPLCALTSIDLALLVKLFGQAPDVAFFVKDAGGRYLAVNESLVIRHGIECTTQVIGKLPSEICPGDFGLVPTIQDAEVLSTAREIVNHLEMQWHRPNNPVWCLTTKLPVFNSTGEVVGLIGFSRDVRVPVKKGEIPEAFAQALEFFENHLMEINTPAALAARAKMSLQRLARLTKRMFGLTPSQFISKTRIAAASRLLLDSSMSISDIALTCGFYDQSAFTRAFRTATGVTPSRFRQLASSRPTR